MLDHPKYNFPKFPKSLEHLGNIPCFVFQNMNQHRWGVGGLRPNLRWLCDYPRDVTVVQEDGTQDAFMPSLVSGSEKHATITLFQPWFYH